LLRKLFGQRDDARLVAVAEKGTSDGTNAARAYVQSNWERRAELTEALDANDEAFTRSLPFPDPAGALDASLVRNDAGRVAAWDKYMKAYAMALYAEMYRLASIDD
jgi:hypothetical protein